MNSKLRMSVLTAIVATVTAISCRSDGGVAGPVSLIGINGQLSALTDAPYPVDPVDTASSPIKGSIGLIGGAVLPTRRYQGTGSGAPSGRYHWRWNVQLCDNFDSCSAFYEYMAGDDSSIFTYTPPSYVAYTEVTALVREVGGASYQTYLTSQVFARGPAWGQAGGSPIPGWPCYATSYPFVEDSTSHNGTDSVWVRNYSRNFCNGRKMYDSTTTWHPL
jgi:hypothetical protein